MKKYHKQPSVIDILNEINSKKLFIFYSFILGIIIASIIGIYKSSGPLKLQIKLVEQYFPIKEEIKHILRYDILNSFDDIDEFKKIVKDKSLIDTINDKKITLEIKSDTSLIGTQNVNTLTLIVTANLDDEKIYPKYTNKIIKAISEIETNSKKKIAVRSTEQINFNQTLINQNKDLFSNSEFSKRKEINELLNLNMLLSSKKFEFLKVYPTNPSFEKNLISTKEFIFVVLGFILAGIFIIVLNRFI